MSLPKEFMKEYLQKSKGATFFGIKIEELSHDELIVMAMCGWEEAERNRKELMKKDLEIFNKTVF